MTALVRLTVLVLLVLLISACTHPPEPEKLAAPVGDALLMVLGHVVLR